MPPPGSRTRPPSPSRPRLRMPVHGGPPSSSRATSVPEATCLPQIPSGFGGRQMLSAPEQRSGRLKGSSGD
eukprot:8061713-Alexandrium_andersonii.AAC.1